MWLLKKNFVFGIILALVSLSTPALGQEQQVDLNKGKQIAQTVCSTCHNVDGNSTMPENPKLAGQHPRYLIKQLLAFRSIQGKPARRVNPIMTAMVANLSDDDIRNVSWYFGQQKLLPAVSRFPDLATMGRNIFAGGIPAKEVPACSSCHGAKGEGVADLYPRVQGQFFEYLQAQLNAFRSKTRPGAMMQAVAGELSDDEIKAVADYIAGLR